jgi:hypothetical protein
MILKDSISVSHFPDFENNCFSPKNQYNGRIDGIDGHRALARESSNSGRRNITVITVTWPSRTRLKVLLPLAICSHGTTSMKVLAESYAARAPDV